MRYPFNFGTPSLLNMSQRAPSSSSRYSGDVLLSFVSPSLLEYVRGLLGLGWLYSPLVLGLIRDKGRLLKGQVSLTWESSKPLYIRKIGRAHV